MKIRTMTALCLIALPSIIAAQETGHGNAISDPRHINEVISRAGPMMITAQRFLLCYEFGPGFVKRGPDSRKRQLDFMINEQLLALGACERGLDTTSQVKEFAAEIEADVATEELYKDDVLGKVVVRENEVASGAAQQKKQLRLSWLFCATQQESAHLDTALHSGASFDSVFARQNPDSISRSERSLETNRFNLSLDNPAFSSSIVGLRPGAPSLPIKGPDGYYIIRMEEAWESRIEGEAAMMKSISDTRRALTQHRADSLSDVYVRRVMESAAPVIQPKAFDLLVDWLAGKFVKAEQRAAWKIGLRTDDARAVARAGDTLVVRRKGVFRVGDFLSWYRTREVNIRLNRSSPSAFAGSVEQIVWRMTRDRLLTAKALERGLQKRASVVSQKKWWKEKMLFELEKSSLVKTIVTDSAMSKDTYEAEITKKMLRRILTLKKKYPVSIDAAALARLPVDEENQPKAIDVYAAKKDGIFPHQAFPAIDLIWQTWE